MQTVSISILKHLLRIDASSIKYYAEESFIIEDVSGNNGKLRHSFFFGIVRENNRKQLLEQILSQALIQVVDNVYDGLGRIHIPEECQHQ